MKKYKNFDLFSQLIIIPIAAISFPFDTTGTISSISLIVLAVLQIISLLIHATSINNLWKEKLLRKIHMVGLLLVLLTMLYGLVKPSDENHSFSGLSIIIYALIPAAALTLFYTFITYLEWKKLKSTVTTL